MKNGDEMNPQKKNPFPITMFSKVKEVSWEYIPVFLFIAVVTPIFVYYLVTVLEKSKIFQTLFQVTRGFVNKGLLFGIFVVGIIIFGLFFGLFKLRPNDIGLQKNKFPMAFFIIVLLWLLIQIILLLICRIGGSEIILDKIWREKGLMAGLGSLNAQFFGIALWEEAGFRGFLFPQLYGKFTIEKKSRIQPLILALVLSQFAWALLHVLNFIFRSQKGNPILFILLTAIVGIVFSLIYLRTKNLYFLVGLHALGNTPTPLIQPPISPDIILGGLLLLVLLLWPKLERRFFPGG